MTVPASLSKWAHPPRSNTPRSSSPGPPGPRITPSTEICVVVMSFIVAAPFSVSWSLVGWLTWSQRLSLDLALDCFFGEDGIDLADGLALSLCRAHGQDLLHGLGAGEHVLDRHARSSLGDLLDADADRAYRRVRVGRAVRVGYAAAQENATRRLDFEDVPVAMRLVARGAGHVVLDATAGRQIMFGEDGRVGRRPPPALELARIRPQLPDALDRCIEFGLNGQGEPLGILAHSGDGHRLLSLVSTRPIAPAVSAMSSLMRSIRARHSSSYWSSRWRATSSASRLVRTTLRRPIRCFVIRPARSRTATCFWTAAKLIG